MRGSISEENIHSYTIKPGIWNCLEKINSATPSWAVSIAGDIKKSMTEIRNLKAFTITEEAMLLKLFIQKFDHCQAEELIWNSSNAFFNVYDNVRQSALIIASKAENGHPAMQLLKKKQKKKQTIMAW